MKIAFVCCTPYQVFNSINYIFNHQSVYYDMFICNHFNYSDIIYQNLRILVGDKFLNKWILKNEFMIDYFEEFKEELEKQYGRQSKFISYLCAISILLDTECDGQKKEQMIKECEYVLNEIEKIKDREKFVEDRKSVV